MFQLTKSEATKPYYTTIDRKTGKSLVDRAKISLHRYGYLAQNHFRLAPTRYMSDRWELHYKGKFYDRYDDETKAINQYLMFVASTMMSDIPSDSATKKSMKNTIEEGVRYGI